MKKLLGWALALCLLLVIAAFITSSQISRLTATTLSKNLKVPVSVGAMNLWWNHINIENLEIDNIPNSYLKKALTIKTTRIDANITHYFDRQIQIDAINIDDIYIGLEFDSPSGTKGNWTVLMSNSEASESPVSNKNAKSAQIKELILTNIHIDIVYKSSGGKVKKLPFIPKLVLHNINTEEGLPTEQIMQSVVGKALQSIFVQENMKNMFEGVIQQPKNAIDTIISPFKGLF